MQLSVFEMIKKGVSTTIDIVDSFARTKIDELNASLGAKQNIADNALVTTAKTIVGAINEHENDILEIISNLSAKQNITDNALATTAKTIVGAINEHENDILEINRDLTPIYFQLNSSGSSVNIEQQDCWCQENRVHIGFSAVSNGVMSGTNVWAIVPNEYRPTSTKNIGYVYIENIANTCINSVKIENNGYVHQTYATSVPANTRITFIADYFI